MTLQFKMIFRRVTRQFGGTKKFILWLLAVIITIYIIDSFILTQDELQTFSAPKTPDAATVKTQEETVKEVKVREEMKTENQTVQPNIKTGAQCGMTTSCPQGQVAYHVRSGKGVTGSPTMCWNGRYLEKEKGKMLGRGLNVAIIDMKTLEVEVLRNFDTYSDESGLERYLNLAAGNGQIALMAGCDDMATSLTIGSKQWIQYFGSSSVFDVGFRDGFAMVGQKGLQKAFAPEKHTKKGDKEFADEAEIQGCVKIPIGALGANMPAAALLVKDMGDPSLKAGEQAGNCGVKDNCPPDTYSVHLYTGKTNEEGPKICVGGKYVIAKGLNDGGRGFNLAIVNPTSKEVVRVGHFDTYNDDSSNLEIFLEMLNAGEMMIAVTHDDASKRLSDHARKLLNEVGSSMIQNLQFRDVWAFVGQKGLEGFSYIEQYEARLESGWPNPIDRRTCVPTSIQAFRIRPDPLAEKNDARRKFCSKYDGYGEFCSALHVDEALTPAPLSDKSLDRHEILRTAIVVIPGLNHNTLRMQLETLLLNPGLDPSHVTVMYDEKFEEPRALAQLFNYKTHKLNSSTKYTGLIEKSLKAAFELNPSAECVIVLEEEVIVTPDLLSFFGQLLAVVKADQSLLGASSWNVNGYTSVSSRPDLVYRTHDMPGYGFLLTRNAYNNYIKDNYNTCCKYRAWYGWRIPNMEMLVPDVSRSYRRPFEGLSEDSVLLTQLFNRDRIINRDMKATVSNPMNLVQSVYEKSLKRLVSESLALPTDNVSDCLARKGLGFYLSPTTGNVYSIFYEQFNATDYRLLSSLTRCFGLFSSDRHAPRGLHNGLLRFSYSSNEVLLIGSMSSYYSFKPSRSQTVKLSQLKDN